MIESFADAPRLWALTGVAALVIVYVVVQFRRRTIALRFTHVDLLDSLSTATPGWKRHLIAALHLVALSLTVVAWAGPQDVERVPKERATIMLAIDTSISMEAEDVDPSRIESAKAAATEFVETVPESLQIGLVSFNGSTTVEVRPTTDRAAVTRAIDRLTLDEGTAIGDAVQVSLDTIAATPPADDGSPPPGVIVLLSDGDTTVGSSIDEAIGPANAAEVAVWTIAYGTPQGFINYDTNGDGVTEPVSVAVSTEPLEYLAEQTGGEAFTAESAQDLNDVYQRLGRSIGYEELPVDITDRVLAVALAGFALAAALGLAWFQRIP